METTAPRIIARVRYCLSNEWPTVLLLYYGYRRVAAAKTISANNESGSETRRKSLVARSSEIRRTSRCCPGGRGDSPHSEQSRKHCTSPRSSSREKDQTWCAPADSLRDIARWETRCGIP